MTCQKSKIKLEHPGMIVEFRGALFCSRRFGLEGDILCPIRHFFFLLSSIFLALLLASDIFMMLLTQFVLVPGSILFVFVRQGIVLWFRLSTETEGGVDGGHGRKGNGNDWWR